MKIHNKVIAIIIMSLCLSSPALTATNPTIGTAVSVSAKTKKSSQKKHIIKSIKRIAKSRRKKVKKGNQKGKIKKIIPKKK